MTNTEKITALNETVLLICKTAGCRMIFVTYFDGGSGDEYDNSGPAIATSLGISTEAHDEIKQRAWREMDRACNYMESVGGINSEPQNL